MDIFFVITFIIIFGFFSWKRLDLALAITVFALPVYQIRFKFFNIPFTLLEIMILVVFAVWFLTRTEARNFFKGRYGIREYIKNKQKRLSYPFRLEVSLFLIVSYLSLVVSGFSNEAMGVWKAYFFEPILIFILVLNVFKKEKGGQGWQKIILALSFSAFAVSIISFVEKVTGLFSIAKFYPRVTGPFLYPNALGLYLAPIVLVMIGWLLNELIVKKRKLCIKDYKIAIVFASIIFSIRTLFLAHSEGAVIGVLAGGAVMLVLSIKKQALLWLAKGLVVCMVLFSFLGPIFFLAVIPQHRYFDFNSKIINYVADRMMLKDFSGEIRKQQWRETWQMLKTEKWLLGTGLSNYQESVKPYHQEGIFFNFDRDLDFRRKLVLWDDDYKTSHWQPVEIYMYPHNIMFNFWTELGLLGAALFVWILFKFFRIGFNSLLRGQKNKYILIGLMSSMVCIIVHGIVDVPYFKNDLAVMFWVIIALFSLLVLDNKNKEENKI